MLSAKALRSVPIATICALTIILGGCTPRSASEASFSQTSSSDASSSTASSSDASSTGENATASSGKSLIAYFSHEGHTRQIAEWIADKTGAELFEIGVADAYPSDYDATVDRADQEKKDNARPAIVANVDNLDDYDTVYLGWPCWWYTCPMAMLTFLEQNDLSGKTVYPFTTHGGSGFSGSLKDMMADNPGLEFADDGLAIRDTQVEGSQETVNDWLAGL